VWNLQTMLSDENAYSEELEKAMHKAIKKVSDDIEKMKFNTVVSTLMSLLNDFYKKTTVTKTELKTYLQLLNPIAPHISEELWQIAGFEGEISESTWPKFDEQKTIDSEIEIAVQMNGKLKSVINISVDDVEETVKQKVHSNEIISKLLEDKQIIKEIYIKGKIYNIVAK